MSSQVSKYATLNQCLTSTALHCIYTLTHIMLSHKAQTYIKLAVEMKHAAAPGWKNSLTISALSPRI